MIVRELSNEETVYLLINKYTGDGHVNAPFSGG